MENKLQLINWLLHNAGDVIRYRTVKELASDNGNYDIEEMQSNLLSNDEVQLWLNNLKPEVPFKWNPIHGSCDWQFENAMLKVVQLGLHCGISQLDEIAILFIKYLKDESDQTANKRKLFDSMLIASLLFRAGYRDNLIIEFMKTSLQVMSKFTDTKNYEIYVNNKNDFKGIPKGWKETPIINPALIEEYGFCYPMIYDVIGLSNMYLLRESIVDEQVDSVIRYIFTDDFNNKIADKYGILEVGQRKYRSMGWDPKLPGYHSLSECAEQQPWKLLFVADVMSDYPIAVESNWFRSVITHLEQFKTDSGTYCFPKEYLREKSGYAVLGMHLGLGENRRKKKWIEVESTFMMLRLKRNVN